MIVVVFLLALKGIDAIAVEKGGSLIMRMGLRGLGAGAKGFDWNTLHSHYQQLHKIPLFILYSQSTQWNAK